MSRAREGGPRHRSPTFLDTDLKWLVSALFVAAMLLLICGLVCFLREVYVATHTVYIGPPR